MTKNKSSENIMRHLYKDQNIICNSFGNSKPRLRDISGKKLKTHTKKKENTRYVFKLLNYTVRTSILKKCQLENIKHIVKLLCRSRRFMNICQLLSYIIDLTLVPRDGCADGLKLCAFILSDCIEYTFCKVMNISKKYLYKISNKCKGKLISKKNPSKIAEFLTSNIDLYIEKNHEKNIVKIKHMISPDHPRSSLLSTKSRLTLLHKPLTQFKHKINFNENILITKCIKLGENAESINDIIQCPVNYVHQAAIITLCFERASKLSTANLYSFLMSLSPRNIPLDVDICFVIGGLIDMARNRVRVKFLEVNDQFCTCHTKCTGYNLRGSLKKELEDEGLKRNTTISCCQRCLLSPLVWNTRAKKPRIKICAMNPTVETCSLDNSNNFIDVPLYTAEYGGFGLYKYQHLFYSTNDISIIEKLCNKKCTGPAAQLYGMCFGGSRTCLFMPKSDIYSSRKEINLHIDKKKFMCYSCAKKIADIDTSRILFGQNCYDYNTCINLSIQELEYNNNLQDNNIIQKVVSKICTGCKLKFLCEHTSLSVTENFKNITRFYSKKLLKKVIKRAQTVNSIILYLLTHSNNL